MDIKKQVVSLTLAKKLKANGYEQEGVWWWQLSITAGTWSILPQYIQTHGVVAPTVAELGERLGMWRKPWLCDDEWIVEVRVKSCGKTIEAGTEANARAKMWLYLKKEGLL